MNNTFDHIFADWQRRTNALEQHLKPIVDATFSSSSDPWDEDAIPEPYKTQNKKLRPDIQNLFDDILNQFENFTPDQRQKIIDLMYRQEALIWSSRIEEDRDTPDGFRKHMIFFVLMDQGKDTRDALLALQQNQINANKAGINTDAIFKEMAELASTKDKFGWGSTRDLLLRMVQA